VVTFALCAACVVMGCGRPATRAGRPNVLLVTLDTTRGDHVGAYGAKPSPTPAFDRVAAEGVLFTRAWTVTPLTTPAHTSLMTGLYPQAHGVRNNGRLRMPEAVTTLAEAFASSGYRTGAFVSAQPVARAFGFAAGFATFDDDFGDDPEGQVRSERTAAEVSARALPWLTAAAASDEPFFAWIHYYDAHAPYEPPSPFAERFAGHPYDGEIAFADAQLGRVLETLRHAGVLEHTVVLLAGDHGEGLGDHGESEHGLLLYEPTIEVPLTIRAPWAIAKGGRRHDLVSLVDLAPTLAALANVPFPGTVDGRDLFAAKAPLPGGDDPASVGPARVVYAESFFAAEEFSWAPIMAVRRGGMKWIAAPRPERYDLDVDPGESVNLAGRDAGKDAAMGAVLARVTVASVANDVGGKASGQLDDELLARLQSLGYVGGGGAGAPATRAHTALRDPKEGVSDYNEYLAGTDQIIRGGDAVALFERLVGSDPGNPEFRLRLGQAYRARGDLAAAEATLRALVGLYPDFYLAYRRLGSLLAAQGRHEESRDLWLKLRARGGGFVGIDKRLAESYLATGQNERALALAEAGIGAAGADAELNVLAGRALERLSRDGEALARYRAALAARPSFIEALDGAIALLRRLGRDGEIRPLIDDCVTRSAGNAAVRERLLGL
jgi:arylsulfatase A-like enzyme/Flp pilus assembly protein TadD